MIIPTRKFFPWILLFCLSIKTFGQQVDVTDDALQEISTRLFSIDNNGVYNQLELDLQSKTPSGNRIDKAQRPLFKNGGLPKEYLSRPTYAKLLTLFDNYLASVNETELVTVQEKNEEIAFLDSVYETAVMKAAHRFLMDQRLVQTNPQRFKEQLRNIWFGLYQRASGKQGSSGFEHVYLGELKNGISGLHSWIRYGMEEAKGNVNYFGYTRMIHFGSRNSTSSGLLELPMELNGVFKPHSTMMIGTSPELEIALYSICYWTRPDGLCPIQWSDSDQGLTRRFKIQTFVSKYRGQRFIGSAYPVI